MQPQRVFGEAQDHLSHRSTQVADMHPKPFGAQIMDQLCRLDKGS